MSDEVETIERRARKRRDRARKQPLVLTGDDAERAKAALRAMLTARPAGDYSHVDARATKAYQRPLKSVASSCHPEQVAEFREEVTKAGLTGVKYDDDGTCTFESREQRKKWNKWRGLVDKDGGIGD